MVLTVVFASSAAGQSRASIQAEPKVSFHDARRSYTQVSGELRIYVESSLIKGNMSLASNSTKKLAAVISESLDSLPTHSRAELKLLRYYLLWGVRSPDGGLGSGMRYVRRGEPRPQNGHDPRWENSIVVYSAENLMYLDELWSKKALVHELAHAWHVTHWPEKYPPILSAWNNAVASGLYTNVADTKNRTIVTAYAVKNPLEYFAELSAAYFVGINYYPFNKSELMRYDPAGYRMIEVLWEPARTVH